MYYNCCENSKKYDIELLHKFFLLSEYFERLCQAMLRICAFLNLLYIITVFHKISWVNVF